MTHAVHALYPILLAAVDVGLAVVLYVVAPVFGVMLATVGTLVAVTLVAQAVNQLGSSIPVRSQARF